MLCSYRNLLIAVSAASPWHTAERKQSQMFLNAHSISVQTDMNFTVVRNMGGSWNFSGWHIAKQHSCWGVRSLFPERQTKKEINCPHIFYSWGPPGNNPGPVDVCPRLVVNDCSCPATTSCSHFGQQRNEQNSFVTVELRKDLSMHTFEANEEHKVILRSVKLILQESVKISIVFTWLPAHQSRSEQATPRQRPAKGTLAGQRALSL